MFNLLFSGFGGTEVDQAEVVDNHPVAIVSLLVLGNADVENAAGVDLHEQLHLVESELEELHGLIDAVGILTHAGHVAQSGSLVHLCGDVGQQHILHAVVDVCQLSGLCAVLGDEAGLFTMVAIAIESLNGEQVVARLQTFHAGRERAVVRIPRLQCEVRMVAAASPNRTVEDLPCGFHLSTLVETRIHNLIAGIDGSVGGSLLNKSIAVGFGHEHPLSIEVVGQKLATLLGANGGVVAIATIHAALRIELHEGIGIVGLHDVVTAVAEVDEAPCASLAAVHVATIGEILAGVVVRTTVAQTCVDVEVGSHVRTVGLFVAFCRLLGSIDVLKLEQCARHAHGGMCAPVGTTGEEALLANIIEIELASLYAVSAEHISLTLGVEVLTCIAQMAQSTVEVALVGTTHQYVGSLVGVDAFAAGEVDGLLQCVDATAIDGAGVVVSIAQSLEGLALSCHIVAADHLASSLQGLLQLCHEDVGRSAFKLLHLGNQTGELRLVDIDNGIALRIFQLLQLQVVEVEPEALCTVVDIAKLHNKHLEVLLGCEVE